MALDADMDPKTHFSHGRHRNETLSCNPGSARGRRGEPSCEAYGPVRAFPCDSVANAVFGMNRLRWQCRRGMRELDLLFQQFLDAQGGRLDAQTAASMLRLLEYPDAVLLEWLLGRQIPSDMEVAALVRRIRSAAAP